MKRFLLPSVLLLLTTLLLLAIFFGISGTTRGYKKFINDYNILSQKMSREGGDNVWDNPYFGETLKQLKENRHHILYLCDSVMFCSGNSDQHTLSQLLENQSGVKTLAVAGPGFSPVLFKEYSRIIDKIPYRPTVVLGVNLRSFSQPWATDYPYRDLRKFLAFQDWRPSLFDWIRFKLDDSDIQPFFEKRYFDDEFARSGYFTQHGFVKDPSGKLCSDYAASYTTPISAEHPMLVDLLKTIRRIRSYGSEVIVYVTPINFENIIQNCGKQTSEIARREIRNIRNVLSSLADPGVVVLDLSARLGLDGFTEPEYPNEHLTERGKEAVAQALAEVLKKHAAANAALRTREEMVTPTTPRRESAAN